MHYLFVDESYRNFDDRRTVIVATWAVQQGRWNRRVPRLNELFKPPIEKRINSMLEELDAFAVVASATLERSLFRAGEIDSTDDIPAMARTDNVWSICVSFAIAYLIKQLLDLGQRIDTIDVYFDPKSLKCDHATAWEKFLRQSVVSEARRYTAQFRVNLPQNLKIRRIQPVEKQKNNQPATKFQMGTWMADRLCSGSGRMITAGRTRRIIRCDMSDVIRRTAQQMDGKSFYDSYS